MKILLIYLQKHSEDLVSGAVGGGAFTLMLTNVDLILKILVAAATLFYFGIKIRKELKK